MMTSTNSFDSYIPWFFLFLIALLIAEAISRKYYNFSLIQFAITKLQEQQTLNKQKFLSGPIDQLPYRCGCIIQESAHGHSFTVKRLCPKHYNLYYTRKHKLLDKTNTS